jgi:hypothetical protein
MNPDELEPSHKRTKPKDLQALSVDELAQYVGQLQAEIERVEKAIAQKNAHRDGLSALFGTPSKGI